MARWCTITASRSSTPDGPLKRWTRISRPANGSSPWWSSVQTPSTAAASGPAGRGIEEKLTTSNSPTGRGSPGPSGPTGCRKAGCRPRTPATAAERARASTGTPQRSRTDWFQCRTSSTDCLNSHRWAGASRRSRPPSGAATGVASTVVTGRATEASRVGVGFW